jgi:hypothetical protein
MFIVGRTPNGYFETVPLRRALPKDLLGISGPPGGGLYRGGMSFEIDSLPRDAIHRGGYETVSSEAFAREGVASCARSGSALLQGAGLLALGLGGALLATRRRPTALVIALAVATAGAFEIGGAVTGISRVRPDAGSSDRQPIAVFASGRTPLPDGARTLAVISPEATRDVGGGLYVARINSPGPYSFAISCVGLSIQIGEGAEILNGGTGSRQLLGCATGELVRGAIADRSDRSDLVEIVVDPNGSTDWRVVVVEGAGVVGPFSEP